MEAKLPPIRVLVLDDDPDDAAFLANLLGCIESMRVQVQTTADARVALRALRTGSCDVCLVDHRMPGRHGLEVVREAREAGCRQPILLVTGSDEADLDIATICAGGSDYLAKDDLDTGRLETALRLALARSGGLPRS